MDALEQAAKARQTGLVVALDEGPRALGVLDATGPDAASFLHSQVTNDVTGLEPGDGNLSARVTRRGHLEQLFSLHRVPDADHTFLMLLDRAQVGALSQGLDAFLFADQLTLTDRSAAFRVVAIQGPEAPALAEAVFGALGFEPWASLPEGAVRPLKRARELGRLPSGSYAIRRSLTGDAGFVLLLADPPEGLLGRIEQAARGAGFALPEPEAVEEVLEILRIEAGVARVDRDLPGKARLLPETGLEQRAVSYTKGCYLGQEVIARVRTYGSVPNLLRALVLDGASLDDLPPVGAEALLEDGTRVGQLVSRSRSPVAGAPVVLAYLDRDHRTPGARYVLRGVDDRPVPVTVVLLPLYAAPDTASRAAHLYDRAIRVFAEGDEDRSIGLLEECLRVDPTFADGYEAIGVILGRTARFHEAIDFFRRLEDVAPMEPMVNTNLSLYYMKLGDKQTAEDESGKAVQKNLARARKGEQSLADIAEEQREAQRRDALRKKGMFEQVLDFDPVDPIALFGMGAALSTLGELEAAVGFLERAREVQKTNSAVYLAWGKALERLERPEEAVAVYKDGVEVASRKGDLMPLKEMEHRLLLLGRR